MLAMPLGHVSRMSDALFEGKHNSGMQYCITGPEWIGSFPGEPSFPSIKVGKDAESVCPELISCRQVPLSTFLLVHTEVTCRT